MRETRPTIDAELIELFENDPEGLAIVDAIRATQRVHVHRAVWKSRPLLLAAAVVVVAIVAGALSLSSSRAGTIERALKAVSVGDVVHLRLVDQRTAAQVVDLTTGQRQPARFTLDEWLNRATGRLRTRASIRGVAIGGVAHGYLPAGTDDEAQLFTRDYPSALAKGRAHVLPGTFGSGRRVIAFDDRNGQTVRVTLGSKYQPAEIRYASGSVFNVEVLPARSANARRLQPIHRVDASAISSAKIVARSAVPAPLRSMIPSTLAGLPLVRVRLLQLHAGSAATPAVEATFGVGRGAQLPARYLRLTVAREPLSAFGWAPWYPTSPHHAWLVREGLPTAFLDVGGLYASVGGKSSDSVVVSAARQVSVSASS